MNISPNDIRPTRSSQSGWGPSTPWLCAGLLLSGMGTVLIGPILPTLARTWQLQDTAAGTLLFAKFIGACLGGLTVPNRLRNGILTGLSAAFVGFGAFAFAPGLVTGALALFVAGFGLGQIIASTDILAGRRYSERTGSALSLINFFWSLGSVITGIVIAAVLPHHSLRSLLLTFASIFIVVAVGGWLQRTPDPSEAQAFLPAALSINAPRNRSLTRSALFSFVFMLFLYGGLETCHHSVAHHLYRPLRRRWPGLLRSIHHRGSVVRPHGRQNLHISVAPSIFRINRAARRPCSLHTVHSRRRLLQQYADAFCRMYPSRPQPGPLLSHNVRHHHAPPAHHTRSRWHSRRFRPWSRSLQLAYGVRLNLHRFPARSHGGPLHLRGFASGNHFFKPSHCIQPNLPPSPLPEHAGI